MGSETALGKTVRVGRCFTEYKLREHCDEDVWGLVIRPGNAAGGWRILEASDGTLLVMLDAMCFAGFTPQSGDKHDRSNHLVNDISPFVLLDADVPGSSMDLDAIIVRVRGLSRLGLASEYTNPGPLRRGCGEISSGVPTDKSLVDAMSSRN